MLFLQSIDFGTGTVTKLMDYYSRTLKISIRRLRNTVVVTNLFVELWSIIQNVVKTPDRSEGVLIGGPMGTGKTTSLFYLYYKLKSLPCFSLIISPAMFQNNEYLPHLVSFCQGSLLFPDVIIHNYRCMHRRVTVLACVYVCPNDHELRLLLFDMMGVFDILPSTVNQITIQGDETLDDILNCIINFESTEQSGVLLIEMGTIRTQNEEYVAKALEYGMLASSKGWYLVISTSSGSAWQVSKTKDNTHRANIVDYMRIFSVRFKSVCSQNFTRPEALKFMELLDIDPQLDTLYKNTNWNPRLLSCFEGTVDKTKYWRAYQVCVDVVLDIIYNLVESMAEDRFSNSLNSSLRWLSSAKQEIPIPNDSKESYKCSYVARENLTRMYNKKGDSHNFYLELWIPCLYENLVVKLKEKYYSLSSTDSAIHQSPILQGYIFEQRFLSHCRLDNLSVAVIDQSESVENLTFDVNYANFQQQGPLTNLVPGQIHHLRVEHPAIDAVCYAKEKSSSSDDDNWFLLLIQVSLSCYEDHRSKGFDIGKSVVGDEKREVGGANVSVAKYYNKLNIQDSHVVYIYASPKSLEEPCKAEFTQELSERVTRTQPCIELSKYRYGFVMKNSKASHLLQQLEQEIRL